MTLHPDRGGTEADFLNLRVAYNRLMKPSVCPECQGKGTVAIKTGMAVKRQKCPICWQGKT